MTLSRRHSQYGVSAEIRRIEALQRQEKSMSSQDQLPYGTYPLDKELDITRNNGPRETIQLESEDEIRSLIDRVKAAGWSVESRYGDTTEILYDGITVPAGTLATRDGMNLTLGWMEMLQMIAGIYDFEALKRVAPKANLDLFTHDMAYGPRIINQIPNLIQVLKADEKTRQAVVFVAKPEDGMTSRLPCTITLQFLLRRDRLELIASMRSWDLCRGLPYDIMMFSGLQMAVARCLSVDPGDLFVRAGSCHIYDGWLDKTPSTEPRRWFFTDDMPRSWLEIQIWAWANVKSLQKGGTPFGIDFIDTGKEEDEVFP